MSKTHVPLRHKTIIRLWEAHFAKRLPPHARLAQAIQMRASHKLRLSSAS